MSKRLLLIDDCPQITKLLTIIVDRYFPNTLQLETALSLDQALKLLSDMTPDIVLLDYRLRPYENCSETFLKVREAGYIGAIHVWSTLDRAFLSAAEDCKDAASLICKLDFQGLRLKDLLEHHLSIAPATVEVANLNTQQLPLSATA